MSNVDPTAFANLLIQQGRNEVIQAISKALGISGKTATKSRLAKSRTTAKKPSPSKAKNLRITNQMLGFNLRAAVRQSKMSLADIGKQIKVSTGYLGVVHSGFAKVSKPMATKLQHFFNKTSKKSENRAKKA